MVFFLWFSIPGSNTGGLITSTILHGGIVGANQYLEAILSSFKKGNAKDLKEFKPEIWMISTIFFLFHLDLIFMRILFQGTSAFTSYTSMLWIVLLESSKHCVSTDWYLFTFQKPGGIGYLSHIIDYILLFHLLKNIVFTERQVFSKKIRAIEESNDFEIHCLMGVEGSFQRKHIADRSVHLCSVHLQAVYFRFW